MTHAILATIGLGLGLMVFLGEVVSARTRSGDGRTSIIATSGVSELPLVPLIIVLVLCVGESIGPGLGIWTAAVLLAPYVPFWWRNLRKARAELEVLRSNHGRQSRRH